MSDYWSRHRTIVITWPPGMPGVFASARWRRGPDGSLSVEYTREELELAVGGANLSRQLPPPSLPPAPAPAEAKEPLPFQPARTVFTRLPQSAGRKLAQQAEQAQQEALL